MSDWSAGYVEDIGYTFGYYGEMNPLWMRLALLNKGYKVPQISTACELGFGQGLNINFHAAGTSVKWYGNDFNPAQADFAQELERACDSGAVLTDESFEDFLARDDMPQFDFITLHGIWSWVSDENRRYIVEFIKKKLNVGGVLYISYNTQPGWAAFAPLRHLMVEHAKVMGVQGTGSIPKVKGALDFVGSMMETNPGYARTNPMMKKRFQKIQSQSPEYLAHEYFNRDWQPMHFSEMADWLEDAKVQFAGSASLIDHIDALNLTKEQQTMLQGIPDLMFRESVRDFMVSQQFRRDLWVKGLRSTAQSEAVESIRSQRLIMIAPRPKETLKLIGSLGEAEAADAIYDPIFELMSDFKPRTFGDIEAQVSAKGVNFSKLLQAVLILAHTGYMLAAQEDDDVVQQKIKTDKLNRHLLAKARGLEQVNYLVSPVTGGAIKAPRILQLFLSFVNEGTDNAQRLAQQVWGILSAEGKKMTREGKVMESEAENIAELTLSAEEFLGKQLAPLKALHIV